VSLWEELFGSRDGSKYWPFPTYKCKYCEATVYVGSPHWCGGMPAPRPGVTKPAKSLTEDDVRKIVREELDARASYSVPLNSPTCPKCGQPYISIPRLGIGHVCSPQPQENKHE